MERRFALIFDLATLTPLRSTVFVGDADAKPDMVEGEGFIETEVYVADPAVAVELLAASQNV